MRIVDGKTFRAERAWGADDLSLIDGASVRLHWTNEPYGWHRNDGREVFVVLDGTVNMHYRRDGKVFVARLGPGEMFVADEGDEHAAEPLGEARILVIERQGSI